MSDETLIEAMARAMSETHSESAAIAYSAGASPAVEYWNRLTAAALAALRETHHLIPKDQEPVGWLYQWKDNEPVYMPQRRDWADYPNNAGWTETPLFAPEKRHDV